MKTLWVTIFCFASISYLKAGDKETYKTYYFFNSSCRFTYTVNTAAILTLYKDSSFSFETYINKYSGAPAYSGFIYAGKWKMNNNVVELKYYSEFAKDKSQELGLTYLPHHCITENDNLLTDSKKFPKLFLKAGKVAALEEKWRYEQFEKTKKHPEKLTVQNFHLNKSLD